MVNSKNGLLTRSISIRTTSSSINGQQQQPGQQLSSSTPSVIRQPTNRSTTDQSGKQLRRSLPFPSTASTASTTASTTAPSTAPSTRIRQISSNSNSNSTSLNKQQLLRSSQSRVSTLINNTTTPDSRHSSYHSPSSVSFPRRVTSTPPIRSEQKPNRSRPASTKPSTVSPSDLSSLRRSTTNSNYHRSHQPSPLKHQTNSSDQVLKNIHQARGQAHADSLEEEDYHTDLVTEVPEHAELDEEMQNALSEIVRAHSSQLSKLRRLLSSADHGSSMTMHLLHGQISSLEERSSSNVKQIEELKKMNGSLVAQLERAKSNVQVESKFRGNTTVEVFKNSSDLELSRYFKSISTKSRLHLLHVLLESALPGDLSSLIKYLTKIEKSKRDFINQLPENLAIRCLLKLDLRSILSCRLVSKKWDEIITRSGKELWRTLCLSLTSMDDEPPRPKRDDSESWFELYQGLYHREENWRLGLAQRVVVLKGHTGSIGALKLRGTTLVTGSLDGTLRIWNIRLNSCLKIVKMPTPVSSLDFFGQYGPGGVIAAGGNDIGRVFLISMSGNILSTLSGHNKGIRTLAMNSEYLVTGGYDKALVVWNWKQGTRIVKFGQQTNPCAAISLFGSSFSSVQVDGVIRCFNILTRELVSQHKVQQSVSSGKSQSNNILGSEMFQWFVAEARRVIIATKTTIYQLEYNLSKEDNYSIDLSSTPRLISITPILHELNSGTIDILKRRFAASPRFATRLGENMRIFLGHLPESEGDYLNSLEERKERRRSRRRESYENQAKSFYDDSVRDVEEDDYEDDGLQPIEGAWLDAESFVSSRNPTVMSLSSDQLVVGCSDGLLYGLDFCGNIYKRKSNNGGIKSDGGD